MQSDAEGLGEVEGVVNEFGIVGISVVVVTCSVSSEEEDGPDGDGDGDGTSTSSHDDPRSFHALLIVNIADMRSATVHPAA